MEINYREYKESDRDDLVGLLTYLQNFERDLEPNLIARGEDVREKLFEKLHKETKENNGRIIVAESTGKTVGSCPVM